MTPEFLHHRRQCLIMHNLPVTPESLPSAVSDCTGMICQWLWSFSIIISSSNVWLYAICQWLLSLCIIISSNNSVWSYMMCQWLLSFSIITIVSVRPHLICWRHSGFCINNKSDGNIWLYMIHQWWPGFCITIIVRVWSYTDRPMTPRFLCHHQQELLCQAKWEVVKETRL